MNGAFASISNYCDSTWMDCAQYFSCLGGFSGKITFAKILYDFGVKAEKIQKLIGHKNLSTTKLLIASFYEGNTTESMSDIMKKMKFIERQELTE